MTFLPGNTWPEHRIISRLVENPSSYLAECLMIDESTLAHMLHDSITSGKHNELYSLAKITNLHENDICNICCRAVTKEHNQHFEEISNKICDFLD